MNHYGKTCCFIGHRKTEETTSLKAELRRVLCDLTEKGADTFIFGDHSEFNTLCYNEVTKLKNEYPQIRRIKFRKDYQDIDESKKKYFLDGYEDNICPDSIANAGKAVYVQRNRAMIDTSDCCIFYYDENYKPERRKETKRSLTDYQPKSGTRLAFEYARSKNKTIINIFKSK